MNGATAHTLMVVDVIPAQWEKIDRREMALPVDGHPAMRRIAQRVGGCESL